MKINGKISCRSALVYSFNTLSSIMVKRLLSTKIYGYLVFSILMLCAGGLSVVRGQDVVGNTTQLSTLIANQTISHLAGKSGNNKYRVQIQAPVNARTTIEDLLLRNGIALVPAANDSASATTIKLEPLVKISFKKISRSTAERTITGTMSLSLIAPDGTLIEAVNYPVDVTDIVSTDYASLDDGSWSMAGFSDIQTSRRGGKFKRILEPAVIISAVSTTIFLLFNVRSQ